MAVTGTVRNRDPGVPPGQDPVGQRLTKAGAYRASQLDPLIVLRHE